MKNIFEKLQKIVEDEYSSMDWSPITDFGENAESLFSSNYNLDGLGDYYLVIEYILQIIFSEMLTEDDKDILLMYELLKHRSVIMNGYIREIENIDPMIMIKPESYEDLQFMRDLYNKANYLN